jgi:hypothetical protein
MTPITIAGLPDALFSNQKSQFRYIFEDLKLENVNIFYVHLEYFMDIFRPFGTFCIYLVHLFRLWYQIPLKIWQP